VVDTVVVAVFDSELEADAAGTVWWCDLVTVQRGEDLVERLGMVRVEACPEGTSRIVWRRLVIYTSSW